MKLIEHDPQTKSTRDFNGLYIRFLHLHFRNSNSENPILHSSLDLIHLHILRQPETPHKLATTPLDTMPRVILVFLLYLPLSTYPNHSVIFDLDFHFLLVEPRKIGLQHTQTQMCKANEKYVVSLSDRRGLEIEIGSMDWKIGDNSVVFWRSTATAWWFGAAAMIGGDGVVFWSDGDDVILFVTMHVIQDLMEPLQHFCHLEHPDHPLVFNQDDRSGYYC
ncbi:hypothetical protein CFP56_012655 [Quercus suber]|uniref:S-protein homolog n=1 Tax=Quercus suber TaxID=58331 RepID=A0AAW0KX85_QUESU